MKKRVTNVSPGQCAKISAGLFALIACIFVPLGVLTALAPNTKDRWLGVFFVFAPIFYCAAGYLYGFIFACVFNFVAQKLGGIEFTVEDIESPS